MCKQSFSSMFQQTAHVQFQIVKFTINFFDVENEDTCDFDKLTIREDGNEVRIFDHEKENKI